MPRHLCVRRERTDLACRERRDVRRPPIARIRGDHIAEAERRRRGEMPLEPVAERKAVHCGGFRLAFPRKCHRPVLFAELHHEGVGLDQRDAARSVLDGAPVANAVARTAGATIILDALIYIGSFFPDFIARTVMSRAGTIATLRCRRRGCRRRCCGSTACCGRESPTGIRPPCCSKPRPVSRGH